MHINEILAIKVNYDVNFKRFSSLKYEIYGNFFSHSSEIKHLPNYSFCLHFGKNFPVFQ